MTMVLFAVPVLLLVVGRILLKTGIQFEIFYKWLLIGISALAVLALATLMAQIEGFYALASLFKFVWGAVATFTGAALIQTLDPPDRPYDIMHYTPSARPLVILVSLVLLVCSAKVIMHEIEWWSDHLAAGSSERQVE